MLPVSKAVKTTCPYCGVGCGVLASIDDLGAVTVRGDPDHPANYGSLCSKGTALGETAYLQDRLLYPEIHGEQVSWEQAYATVAGRLSEIIQEHGADAVAFYVSGQLLTEDYYVANKLMKGFIGSANIDTNSRLCMSSAVAAYKRAFGEDCVPCSYEDLDKADLIVLTGSNAAWCHPILFQKIVRAKKSNSNLRVINIDPRETQTSSAADIQLSLKPATDGILFNGLLVYLDQMDARNTLFTNAYTNGLDDALQAARESAPSVEFVAEQCQLAVEDVEAFYHLFACTEKVVTVFSQGINQSSSGVDKGNAIINCHLLTGRLGRTGMGPFSFTGQPNAMGGREVGGLSNQLAAHMELENPRHRDRVQRFWNSPVIADKSGYKAVELMEAVESGKVKALWIIATNPVVSMPDADRVKKALEQCELVIVSDCVRETDSAKQADILLPALTWGERDGTVTNTERMISRQHPFLAAPGQAKADWDIINEVAHRMGFGEYFPYRNPADVFREHAALSGFENEDCDSTGDRADRRIFDIGVLKDITNSEYDQLKPMQWPITKDAPNGTKRLYKDGRFTSADGKAQFITVIPRPPASAPTDQYPFTLNTGRVRDQWHTMTRTGMSPRLSSHTFEPYVEIHPDDARHFGIKDKSLCRLTSPLGHEVLLRVSYSKRQQQGSLFVPMHWNNQFSSMGRIGTLIKAVTDPVSGQPESKHSIAAIEDYPAHWYGFILTADTRKLSLKYASYWARSRGKGLWRYEIAGQEQPADWAQRARDLLGREDDDNWAEYFDTSQNHYRAAQFKGERLKSCIFIGPTEKLPQREWLISLFQKDSLNKKERASILTGNPPVDQEDVGRIVCACFNVGEKTILKAIKEQGLDSAEKIGECLQAGTNCGSCLPELRELIDNNSAP